MHVDHLTLACLRDRLDGLLGARVQRVVLPDNLSVGLELYAGERFQLLISANPQYPRMLLVPHKVRRGVETPTPLLQLMRKWVRGARLVDVTQPPWERILVLHFDGYEGRCRLVAELIGHYSNVILVGPDDQVLEATKRVGPDQNRYRVTLPAHPYQPPPPPPGRRPPAELTPEEAAAMLASDPDTPLHRLLTRRLFAVSPTAAREIACRATEAISEEGEEDPEAVSADVTPEGLAGAVEELFSPLESGRWAPHVALDAQGDVIAFAPYRPHQFERVEPTTGISEAMWRFFCQRISADEYAAARRRVEKLLQDAQEQVKQALEQLEAQRVDQEEVERLREAGELLLTYQGQVEPGMDEVTLPDYEGNPRAIELDPALSVVDNAQAYFRRYRKAMRTVKKVPARIASLKNDRAYLEQLAADLALAESRPEIDAVRDALAEGGWVPEPSRPGGGQVSGPRRFDVQGFPILVGRNAKQNAELTFKDAGPDDTWLHVRGRPGAHVVIKNAGRPVPEEVVQIAAQLAAYYSSARDSRGIDVDVTERRFVRRLRGAHPGLVSYRNERTIWVEDAGEVG